MSQRSLINMSPDVAASLTTSLTQRVSSFLLSGETRHDVFAGSTVSTS